MTIKELHTKYKTPKALLEANLNIEAMELPTYFKRLHFIPFTEYKVNKPDYYGNLDVYCTKPKTLCAISLLFIYNNNRGVAINKCLKIAKSVHSDAEYIQEILKESNYLIDIETP